MDKIVITPGDVLAQASIAHREMCKLDQFVSDLAQQEAVHRLGERVEGGKNAVGVPTYTFRVKAIRSYLREGLKPAIVIEYSGPRFKKDGSEHATATGYTFQHIHL